MHPLSGTKRTPAGVRPQGGQQVLQSITGGVAGMFKALKIFSPENLAGKKKRRNFAGLSGNGRCAAAEGQKIVH